MTKEKRFIQLTGVPHPDVGRGESQPIYIDADKVISIERTRVGYAKEGSLEEMRQITEKLARSLRTAQISGLLNLTQIRSDEEAKIVIAAAAGLASAIDALVARPLEPETYPRIDCTMVTLSAGQLWKTFFVTETPAEVAQLIEQIHY